MSLLTCRHCDSEFVDPRPPTRGRRPAYCSDDCRKARARAYNSARAAQRRLHGWCLDCPESQPSDAVAGDFCQPHYDRRADGSKRRYGITLAEYDALYAAQSGVCAVCARPEGERRFSIDHDHSCCPGDRACGECVRGLLCSQCNSILGLAQDRTDVLLAAVEYLRAREQTAPTSQT